MSPKAATYGSEAVPIHLKEANEFVARHYRHNLPTMGNLLALLLNGFR